MHFFSFVSFISFASLAFSLPLFSFLPKEDLDNPNRLTTKQFAGSLLHSSKDVLSDSLDSTADRVNEIRISSNPFDTISSVFDATIHLGADVSHTVIRTGSNVAKKTKDFAMDHKGEIAGFAAGAGTAVVIGVPVAAGVTAVTENPVIGGAVGGVVGGAVGGFVGNEVKDAVKRHEKTGSPLPKIHSIEDVVKFGVARANHDAIPVVAGGVGGGIGGAVSGGVSSAVSGVAGQALGGVAGTATTNVVTTGSKTGMNILTGIL